MRIPYDTLMMEPRCLIKDEGDILFERPWRIVIHGYPGGETVSAADPEALHLALSQLGRRGVMTVRLFEVHEEVWERWCYEYGGKKDA